MRGQGQHKRSHMGCGWLPSCTLKTSPLVQTKALGQALLSTLLGGITRVTTWLVAHWTNVMLGKGLTKLPNPMTCQMKGSVSKDYIMVALTQ